MPGETVEQLAKSFGVDCERLIEQFTEAGFKLRAKDKVSEEAKQALLVLLKRDHGEALPEGPKKITLKRQSKTEIKVQRSSGRKGTVSVVRKRRHVYVKRDATGAEDALEEGESTVAVEVVEPVSVAESVSKADESLVAKAEVPLMVEEPVVKEVPVVSEVAPQKEDRATTPKKARLAKDLLDEEEKKRGRSKQKAKVEIGDL